MRFIKILFLAIVISHFSCKKKEEVKVEQIRPVKTEQVQSASELLSRGLPAVSTEHREVDLSFRVGGPLIQLNIETGAAVVKGQLLAEIDPRDYRVALVGFEGRMNQAKAEEQRYKNLHQKGSVSKNEYDIKLANYLEAKANYDNAENNLRDTKLYAPFNGFIGEKLVENFQEVTGSQTIATILDLSKIEIHTHVPENLALFFPQFKSYEVVFDAYPSKQFTAVLKEIGKTPDPAGYPLTLYLDYSKKDITDYLIAPGLTCEVDIKLADNNNTSSFIVPLTAVFEGDVSDVPSVWLMDKTTNIVSKQDVTVGPLISHSSIEIRSGVKSGDWIITAGVYELTNGQKVKPLMEKL